MKTLPLLFCLSLSPLSTAFAETLHFVTEEYAPFNYTEGGRIIGITIDQIEAISAAAGIDYTLDIMPWARALAMAEKQPGTCVFTAGYNRERAERFAWITPLLRDEMVLLKRKDGTPRPASLEEARTMKVGAQRGDFAVEALEEIGFTDIDLAADIDITLGKLLSGRIDLMPTSAKTFKAMVADGRPVEKALLMEGRTYGVACNTKTSPELIARMQGELDKLILSGEQDRIFAAYGLPPNPRTAAGGRGN